MENAPGAPAQDPELASMLVVFQELARLPDDESRRRVIAYAQSRCIGRESVAYRQDPGYLQQLRGWPSAK